MLLTDEISFDSKSVILECEKGHQWSEPFYKTIIRKYLCKTCYPGRRLTIQIFKDIAIKKGGVCLSEQYINLQSRLDFKCKEGHVWTTRAKYIREGKWCPVCGRIHPGRKSKMTIEILQQIAIDRGGRLLTESYVSHKSPLHFECKNGHQWFARQTNIINQKSWCNICSRVPIITLQDVIDAAKKHGGNCLSTEYIRGDSKMEFQCAQGHIWMATPKSVREGHWCRKCATIKRTEKRFGKKKIE
jgi:hypothetical protein